MTSFLLPLARGAHVPNQGRGCVVAQSKLYHLVRDFTISVKPHIPTIGVGNVGYIRRLTWPGVVERPDRQPPFRRPGGRSDVIAVGRRPTASGHVRRQGIEAVASVRAIACWHWPHMVTRGSWYNWAGAATLHGVAYLHSDGSERTYGWGRSGRPTALLLGWA